MLDGFKKIIEVLISDQVKPYVVDPVTMGGWPAIFCVGVFLLAVTAVWILVRPWFTLRNIQLWLYQRQALVALGTLCMSTAVIWIWTYGTERISMWAILPVATGSFFFHRLYNQKIPDDRLVVAIAPFRAIGTTKEEAEVVCYRIARNLSLKKDKGVPVEVKEVKEEIRGNSVEERRAEVIKLGKLHRANIILWGDLFRDETEVTLTTRFQLVQKLRTAFLEEERLPVFQQTETECLEFKKRAASEIADLVTLVYAMAWYKVGDFERAISLLQLIPTKAGYFFLGRCLAEKAENSPHPGQEYEKAISAYSKVIAKSLSEMPEDTNGSSWKERAD